MSILTDTIRRHHGQLAYALSTHVAAATGAEKKRLDLRAFVAFLKNELLPHASGEEHSFYPRIDFLIQEYARGSATMSVDHEFIANYVHQIERTADALAAATGDRARELESELERLALKLETILTLHLEKEERVYLPLAEKHLPETEQERILDEMHAEQHATHNECPKRSDVLDVRSLAPRERHAVIFETFGALGASQSFVLINDHDPKPLFYQFQAEHTDQFSWNYLEQGPEVWRVQIGRL